MRRAPPTHAAVLIAACLLLGCGLSELSAVDAHDVGDDDHDYYGPEGGDSDLEVGSALTLDPVADAFVRSGASASRNYGSEARLHADANNRATELHTYLRFDLSTVAEPIVRARLRFYVTNGSKGAVQVAPVQDTGWAESAITWDNKPAMGPDTIATMKDVLAGSFVTLEVTSAAQAGGLLAFGLRPTSGDGVSLASREVIDAPRRPQLILDFDSPPSDGGSADGGEKTDGGVADGGEPGDTSAPTVSITSPASGSTFTKAEAVTLSTSAADDVGITRVEFYDGLEMRGSDSAEPFTFVWNVTSNENGTHTWTARAYDAAGNQTTSSPMVATVAVPTGPQPIPTEPNLKVAYIGDTGAGSNYKAVLNLIKAENVDFVVHNGDFDYQNNASVFFTALDSVLGAGYPYYFVSKGNHDTGDWTDYAAEFKKRWDTTGAVIDDPNLNDEMWTLTFKGLQMVMVGQNGNNAAFASFINSKLTGDNHIWKMCNWHKNQNAMQLGTKSNEMGWDVYENCRKLGAVIATGHEHSYSRTFTLTNMTSQVVDTTCHPGAPADRDRSKVCIGPGRTIAFVSGLGGVSIRNQDRCLPASFPYGCKNEWANVYASDQSAKYGALFITYNIDGNPKKARGVFKTVSGQVIDDFVLWKD